MLMRLLRRVARETFSTLHVAATLLLADIFTQSTAVHRRVHFVRVRVSFRFFVWFRRFMFHDNFWVLEFVNFSVITSYELVKFWAFRFAFCFDVYLVPERETRKSWAAKTEITIRSPKEGAKMIRGMLLTFFWSSCHPRHTLEGRCHFAPFFRSVGKFFSPYSAPHYKQPTRHNAKGLNDVLRALWALPKLCRSKLGINEVEGKSRASEALRHWTN